MTNFNQLSIDDAKQKITQTNVYLIDVRDVAAYQKSHIAEAINLNQNQLDEFVASADKSYSVIVYCYLGHTSQAYAQFFVDQGFGDVNSIDGGYEAWQQA